jgi:predicted transcriptional regulator
MNTRYIKVEGHENLFRDSFTGAIVNTDKPAPKNFSKQFNTVIEDINSLKAQLSEIKSLLNNIVKNGIRT